MEGVTGETTNWRKEQARQDAGVVAAGRSTCQCQQSRAAQWWIQRRYTGEGKGKEGNSGPRHRGHD